jgi:predicted RNase H-like nuclease (RuvC/YqgF family)
MSDLEKKIDILLSQFLKLKKHNEKLSEELQTRHQKIENLRKTVTLLSESQQDSASMRHQIRHLEKERSILLKSLEELRKRVKYIQEKLNNVPEPM